VSVNLVLVQGMADTRRALARWNRAPADALRPWLTLSLTVSAALLLAVCAIAKLSVPDPTPLVYPGLNAPATAGDYVHILIRNGLVLALHAMACVAGFIAGSSLPLSASHRRGLSRWVHEKAGPLAIAFVTGATVFSLGTQAFVLGSGASTLAAQGGIAPGLLLLGLLPHAMPELTALFLPLAAWLIASRRGEWEDLLAATVVTVAVAVPVLLASAAVELWVSPDLLRALAS
jgi:uncharacterized membrane protein